MIDEFEKYLKQSNLSSNTISSYLFTLKQFIKQYENLTLKNLRSYKTWLIETYKPKTVNLRIRAINCFLESIGKDMRTTVFGIVCRMLGGKDETAM